MTTGEFDNTGFTSGMKVFYRGDVKEIRSIDFEERLIGIDSDDRRDNDIVWIRPESCELMREGG